MPREEESPESTAGHPDRISEGGGGNWRTPEETSMGLRPGGKVKWGHSLSTSHTSVPFETLPSFILLATRNVGYVWSPQLWSGPREGGG